MSDKIYCGNAKVIKTKFGEVPKISMSKKDINTIVEYMKDNNLEWINIEMLPKQKPEQGKPTHYLKVDTWKPNKDEPNYEHGSPKSDGLPF